MNTLYSSCFPPQSLIHSPPLLTVQTLSREHLMTHVVDKVSPTDVVMPWRRSLNPRSCAGGSPLVLGCCSAGCVDCHYGNGGVHDDEEDDGCAGWVVLGQSSMESSTPENNCIKQTSGQMLESPSIKWSQSHIGVILVPGVGGWEQHPQLHSAS